MKNSQGNGRVFKPIVDKIPSPRSQEQGEIDRVKEIVDRCKLPGVSFVVGLLGPSVYIRAGIVGDNLDALWSAPWNLTPGQTSEEIASALFKGALSVMKRYAYMSFTLDGFALFDNPR